MWIGWMEFDLLLGDVHSLKQKRSLLRPLIADLSRRTQAAVAEVGAHDLHRRAAVGVSVVGADIEHVRRCSTAPSGSSRRTTPRSPCCRFGEDCTPAKTDRDSAAGS